MPLRSALCPLTLHSKSLSRTWTHFPRLPSKHQHRLHCRPTVSVLHRVSSLLDLCLRFLITSPLPPRLLSLVILDKTTLPLPPLPRRPWKDILVSCSSPTSTLSLPSTSSSFPRHDRDPPTSLSPYHDPCLLVIGPALCTSQSQPHQLGLKSTVTRRWFDLCQTLFLEIFPCSA